MSFVGSDKVNLRSNDMRALETSGAVITISMLKNSLDDTSTEKVKETTYDILYAKTRNTFKPINERKSILLSKTPNSCPDRWQPSPQHSVSHHLPGLSAQKTFTPTVQAAPPPRDTSDLKSLFHCEQASGLVNTGEEWITLNFVQYMDVSPLAISKGLNSTYHARKEPQPPFSLCQRARTGLQLPFCRL
jgi:hypothetical protein